MPPNRATQILLVATTLMLAMAMAPSTSDGAGPAEQESEPSEAMSPESYFSGERRISNPTSPECARYYPKAAYDWVHDEYLVVWYNWWSLDFHDIYARRVTSAGELKSWFCVATGANGDGKTRSHPAVAYNALAGEYLVVYMYDALGDGTHYEVWGRRVAWNGSSMGSEFQIFSWANRAFWTPRVAWNSYRNEYMVVANALDTTTGLWNDVAGRRVMADGSTPYPGHNISSQSQTLQPHQSDIAYNLAADEYLVVWRQRWAGDDWDIYGARVRGDNGSVVNPPGVFVIDATAVNEQYPAVATNEQDRYLVVWQHGVGMPTTDWDIYGRELYITGGWASTHIQIAVSLDSEQYPDVAVNGANNRNMVVWRRTLAGSGDEIWGFDWDPSAAWIVWLPFRIAPNVAWTPPVIAGGYPSYLIAYGRIESTALHIWGRTWAPYAVFVPIILRNG